jgi:2-amino-4-hydroxy-6-hydroxymethyldihydropteridine diphosphokinase
VSAGAGRRGRTQRVAYLGLGSNVGDRLAHLRSARDLLVARELVRDIRASSVYETEAVEGAAGQADFLNACLAGRTELTPEELLAGCKAVEGELGRELSGVRHGPRPIDVDLLLMDGLEHRSERLTLPHPEIVSRRFVLLPLLELDPELALPDGRRLLDGLPAVAAQRVERRGRL